MKIAQREKIINVYSKSWVLSLVFNVFLRMLCISLVLLIFPYSAQILLENVLFCRQNARSKNHLFCSKLCQQNLSKPTIGQPRSQGLSSSRPLEREVSTSTSSAILNISRSPPRTLPRLRMPYFLVLVSHVRTSQANGCAWACAYRTSGNQALRFKGMLLKCGISTDVNSYILHKLKRNLQLWIITIDLNIL